MMVIQGYNSSLWGISITIYTAVVIVVDLKLAIFTKYPGPDPESSSNGNGTTNQGVDRNQAPNARTITVGLNIGF